MEVTDQEKALLEIFDLHRARMDVLSERIDMSIKRIALLEGIVYANRRLSERITHERTDTGHTVQDTGEPSE